MSTSPNAIQQNLPRGLGGIICLGLIVFVVLGGFFLLPANIYHHVTERYIFSGRGGNTSLYLGVMLPKSGPYQDVKNLEILWDGFQDIQDHGFVDIIKFSGETSHQGNFEAIIEYDVKLPQRFLSWPAPVEGFQRLPQVGIDSNCECMQEKAASIKREGGEKNAYRIYAFVVDYLTYEGDDSDCAVMSASDALKIGSCACRGYACLMTALCRASDIPAQMMLGLVYPDPMFKSHLSSFPENPNEAHAWVEYYDGESWKMADPTWALQYLKFMQFGRNDGRHLAYGELEQILNLDEAMEMWALEQAEFRLGDGESFRYVATSDSAQLSFLPTVSIQRKWDGRWLNTLIVWGIMTWGLCKYRDKLRFAKK
ncbi:MAG: transglutaminase domain-containing protein [Chloroflexi bacterium]|nr:transglutaminase domain-containing protein [Chloroflexota bacterium]